MKLHVDVVSVVLGVVVMAAAAHGKEEVAENWLKSAEADNTRVARSADGKSTLYTKHLCGYEKIK